MELYGLFFYFFSLPLLPSGALVSASSGAFLFLNFIILLAFELLSDKKISLMKMMIVFRVLEGRKKKVFFKTGLKFSSIIFKGKLLALRSFPITTGVVIHGVYSTVTSVRYE